jgi:Flp pilus assembly protein TadD
MSPTPPNTPASHAAAEAAGAAPGRKRLIVTSVLLFLAVVGTFWPALHNSYVNYDDPDYLITNLQVQDGLNWANVKWAFVTTAATNWHPLTWLSHMLDCEIFGPKLWGHHLTNVLLHGLNAVLVFLLFNRGTGSFWRSLLLAACFGLHPLRVESVAWLSERKDVLSGCFGLAALLAYVSYARKSARTKSVTEGSSHGQPAGTFVSRAGFSYTLALVLFALSLLSKPMMVTLPCVLVLLDFWPLQRTRKLGWGRILREKIPFLMLATAMCVVTFLVQRSGGAMEQMSHYGTAHHVANALVSYLRYLGKFFWPTQLAPIYPVVEQWSPMVVTGAALLIGGVTAACIGLRTKASYALVGWLWFLGTLVPVIGLVAVGEQAMADRYTYFTQLGLALMLIWGGEALTRSWRGRVPVAGVVSVGILLACVAATRQQTKMWANSETLFRHTLAVTTHNYSAHANLSAALEEAGQLEESLFHAREAARLRPDSPEAVSNWGAALARVGRIAEAITTFREVLRLQPKYADGHRNLAIALLQSGQVTEAIEHYAEAVKLSPDQAVRHHDFGIALAKAGRLNEAIVEFQEAVRLEPRYAIAHQNLAQALEQQGRFGEAAVHFKEAARLNAGGKPAP